MNWLFILLVISAWPLPAMAASTYLTCLLRPTKKPSDNPRTVNYTLNESAGTLSASLKIDPSGTAKTFPAVYGPTEIIGTRKGTYIYAIHNINRVTGVASYKLISTMLPEVRIIEIYVGACRAVQAPSRKF